jgi:hypothetical protein
MIIVTAFMSVLFIGLAFLLNEKNSEYLLSGYNTMSKADREQFDIVGYLKIFKRFHIILGATLLPGVLLIQLINEVAASTFMIMYVLGGYLFFMIRTRSFSMNTKNQKTVLYVSMVIMVVTIIGVGYLLLIGFKDNPFVVKKDLIEIEGFYGIEIKKGDLETVAVVDQLPPISTKSNGFAAGGYSKGNFKTKAGTKVKLFTTSNAKPYLFLKTKNGEVYYSSTEVPAQALMEKIKNEWQLP